MTVSLAQPSQDLTPYDVLTDYDPTRDKTYRRAKLAGDVTAWLDWMELGNASPRTLDNYERVLAILCLLYPNKTIHEITDADLLAMSKRFKHPTDRRTRMAAVKSFFKWARQTRRIVENPCDYLPTIKNAKPKVHDVFTDPEIEALLSLPLVDAAPMGVLLEGGLRKAEARQLLKRDCVAENGVIVVREGKGKKDRIVPMSKRLQVLILDLEEIEKIQPREFVFYKVFANDVSRRIDRSSPIGEGTFARWWKRCIETAGVRYRNPHMARHTAATRWRRMGVDMADIKEHLGHSSLATTEAIYVHTTAEERVERFRLLEEAGA